MGIQGILPGDKLLLPMFLYLSTFPSFVILFLLLVLSSSDGVLLFL